MQPATPCSNSRSCAQPAGTELSRLMAELEASGFGTLSIPAPSRPQQQQRAAAATSMGAEGLLLSACNSRSDIPPSPAITGEPASPPPGPPESPQNLMQKVHHILQQLAGSGRPQLSGDFVALCTMLGLGYPEQHCFDTLSQIFNEEQSQRLIRDLTNASTPYISPSLSPPHPSSTPQATPLPAADSRSPAQLPPPRLPATPAVPSLTPPVSTPLSSSTPHQQAPVGLLPTGSPPLPPPPTAPLTSAAEHSSSRLPHASPASQPEQLASGAGGLGRAISASPGSSGASHSLPPSSPSTTDHPCREPPSYASLSRPPTAASSIPASELYEMVDGAESEIVRDIARSELPLSCSSHLPLSAPVDPGPAVSPRVSFASPAPIPPHLVPYAESASAGAPSVAPAAAARPSQIAMALPRPQQDDLAASVDYAETVEYIESVSAPHLREHIIILASAAIREGFSGVEAAEAVYQFFHLHPHQRLDHIILRAALRVQRNVVTPTAALAAVARSMGSARTGLRQRVAAELQQPVAVAAQSAAAPQFRRPQSAPLPTTPSGFSAPDADTEVAGLAATAHGSAFTPLQLPHPTPPASSPAVGPMPSLADPSSYPGQADVSEFHRVEQHPSQRPQQPPPPPLPQLPHIASSLESVAPPYHHPHHQTPQQSPYHPFFPSPSASTPPPTAFSGGALASDHSAADQHPQPSYLSIPPPQPSTPPAPPPPLPLLLPQQQPPPQCQPPPSQHQPPPSQPPQRQPPAPSQPQHVPSSSGPAVPSAPQSTSPYSPFLPADCVSSPPSWALGTLPPEVTLTNVRPPSSWQDNLLSAPAISQALEVPTRITAAFLSPYVNMARDDHTKFAMGRGHLVDGLAECYLYHRCLRMPDKVAADRCTSVLVAACQQSEHLRPETIRLLDLVSVFLQVRPHTVRRSFEEIAAREDEGAAPLLNRIHTAAVALSLHKTSPSTFDRVVLDQWSSVIYRIFEKSEGAPHVEALVNKFANNISNYRTIGDLGAALSGDTRAHYPLLSPRGRGRGREGQAHAADSEFDFGKAIREALAPVHRRLDTLQLAEVDSAAATSGFPAEQASASTPLDGAVANPSLNITAEQAAQAYAALSKRLVCGALRIADIAATGRVAGFKGAHPTIINPRRKDGKFGWDCLQCAASREARDAGSAAELEEVEPFNSSGERVDRSRLKSTQVVPHFEPYCPKRWRALKQHCTANPQDRWMCVTCDSTFYAAKNREAATAS